LGRKSESKPQEKGVGEGAAQSDAESGGAGNPGKANGEANGELKMENGKLGDAKDANGAKDAKDAKDANGANGADSAIADGAGCGAENGDGAAESGAAEGAAAALQAEAKAERDKYLRLAAEYDNFRKRSAKEREMIYGDARIDTISRLLPVYDNLERAMKMECADEAFFKGIELTMAQLTEILENMDVTRIPAVGEKFDPNRHNAVMTIENPALGEKTVAEEFQKGFALGDRVIRFSTVVVAN